MSKNIFNQYNLYTVAVGQDEQVNLEVIGAVEEVLFSNQVEKILGYMTSEELNRFKPLEKGYCHLPSTGHLEYQYPLIQHDSQHIDDYMVIGFVGHQYLTREKALCYLLH